MVSSADASGIGSQSAIGMRIGYTIEIISVEASLITEVEILPANKAYFQVFTAAALDGQIYGELRIYYVPLEEIALSDKDIIASFSNSYNQGNKLKFMDGEFEEPHSKLGTRLIAPYFDIEGNNYLLIRIYSPFPNRNSAIKIWTGFR